MRKKCRLLPVSGRFDQNFKLCWPLLAHPILSCGQWQTSEPGLISAVWWTCIFVAFSSRGSLYLLLSWQWQTVNVDLKWREVFTIKIGMNSEPHVMYWIHQQRLCTKYTYRISSASTVECFRAFRPGNRLIHVSRIYVIRIYINVSRICIRICTRIYICMYINIHTWNKSVGI